MTTVRIRAAAKVNPTLHVLARRDDGFHEVDTTLMALELADELELSASESPGVQLTCDGPFASADIPTDARNLAFAAARAAFDRAAHEADGGSLPAGIRLRLTKNIPSQAGLGGGSSDAAAAWRGVETLLDVTLDRDARRAALGALGSDCVFFGDAVNTGVARCTGRGERVVELAAPPADWVVALVTPSVPCPTGAIYSAWAASLSASTDPATVPAPPLTLPARQARAGLHNDLESAALVAVPELRAWRAVLADAGASDFLLSGSGSSFFGLFDDDQEAARILDRVRSGASEAGLAHRGTWVTRPAGCLTPPTRS